MVPILPTGGGQCLGAAGSFKLLALLAIIALFASLAAAVCNPATGPSGFSDCLSSPAYSDLQYATCLTSAYVVQKSRGERSCSPDVNYCRSPCMVYRYDHKSGSVSDDCRCTAAVPQSTLAPNCTSPVGTDCSWYRECLAVAYPCGGQDGYALGYGDAICRRYDERLSKFSARGLAWLNAARRCLQVQLAPVLYVSNEPYTCDEVKQMAFDTHVGCYLSPYEGFSFCDLSLRDKFQVFMAIKSAFFYQFSEAMRGLINVMKSCFFK